MPTKSLLPLFIGLGLCVEASANAVAAGDPGLPGTLLYLDPGTGSLLFSVIVGVASTAYFVARDLLYQAGSRLGMLLSPKSAARMRAQGQSEFALVLYSEGRQYAATFGPLLDQLAARGLPCLYLSSEPDDPLLALADDSQHPQLRTECIGSGHLAWARLRTLRAKLVCMTTPGLDVMQIRRSPHVRHYTHLIHSPTDKSFNRPFSFDFFDSVMISGPHQRRVIRALEKLRGRTPKELHDVGCVYYDRLVPRYAKALARTARQSADSTRSTSVLLAPTWGRNGLLHRGGSRLIGELTSAGLDLVIRPHPQSVRSEPELIDGLRKETASIPNCGWDFSDDPVEAMAASDILVSDISGIVFDYAFVTGRPVLTMDIPIDKRGFEAMDLDFEPWEVEILDLIGRRIGQEDVARLGQIVAEELADRERSARILAARDRYVTNFGNASSAAMDVIARIAELAEVPSENRLSVQEVSPTPRPVASGAE